MTLISTLPCALFTLPSAHLIANMIRHAVYTDVASCQKIPTPELGTDVQPKMDPLSRWRKGLLQEMSHDPETRKLMDYLLRNDVRVASFSLWQPSIGHSMLQIGNPDDVSRYPREAVGGGGNFRNDVKYAFRFPHCSEKNAMVFQLNEPHIEWLGVGAGNHCTDVVALPSESNSPIEWKINEIDVEDPDDRKMGKGKGMNWIHIPTMIERRGSYEVTFCNTDPTVELHLCHLVGVMTPTMNDREAELLQLFMH